MTKRVRDSFRFMAMAALVLVFAGCMSTPPIKVSSSDLPYSKQFQMQSGNALLFQLPDGKTVAVWCERPEFGMMLGEQTTRSGLKTAWGEKPFKQPEPIERQIGPNSYTYVGWRSYIEQGAVTTTGDRTSEYELFVGNLRFCIVEDLRATGSLPVTINITRK